MKPKEIAEKLGIDTDRIKFFKREGVFTPDNPPIGNRSTDYTEDDFRRLQLLVVLTKSGLTCTDIKKMQVGDWTLEEAVRSRRQAIDDEITRKRNSLSLLAEILDDKVEYETFPTDHYWNVINCREAAGEEFMDFEDLYGYQAVSLTREVVCPHCGVKQEIDLEDYIIDESSDESENGMGPDMVYSFDTEDGYEYCDCGRFFRVSGWIREYPMGAYDSESIDVEKVDGEEE